MLDKLLYEKLCHFCEYQERCKYDVSKKCYALKIPKTEVPAYMEQLEKSGFLNLQLMNLKYIPQEVLYMKNLKRLRMDCNWALSLRLGA